MRYLFLFLTALFSLHAEEDTFISLPAKPPVKVETSFYLANLDTINEHDQTFDANIYIDFKWNDPRLIFKATPEEEGKKIYLGDSAKEKLKTIWWPEVDFLNQTTIQFNNISLTIYEDGTALYSLSVTATFRAALNYRRFPFDHQSLPIEVISFMWDTDVMQFVPEETAFDKNTKQEFSSLFITEVKSSLQNYSAPTYEKKDYSTYVATIYVQRNPAFYVYQMLIPLFLVMGISFCAFLFPITDLPNKIYLALTGILAFFWTKFSINEDLPRIGYMTLLDKAFLISYIFGALTVFVSALEYPFLRDEATLRRALHRKVRWALPLLYVILVILIFIFP